MKNIYILPEYWTKDFIGACGWIRLLDPLLSEQISTEFNIDYGYSLSGTENKIDIVIFERLWHPNHVDITEILNLIKNLRKNNVKIIYSIDDNLLDFPNFQKSVWYTQLHLSVLNIFLHYADAVVVSTAFLKLRLSEYNDNITVIPNAIDPSKITIRNPNTSDKIKFGYLASPDNQQYLISILEPLRKVLYQNRKHITFEIIGHNDIKLLKHFFKSLPVEFRIVPYADYHKYIPWLQDECNWDFGIAPIIKNEFTKCKSDMKFIDFTRLGIPGIYTDFTPYDSVKENNVGIVVENDWESAITLMIKDKELRSSLLNTAINYISKERNFDNQINQWKQLLNELIYE